MKIIYVTGSPEGDAKLFIIGAGIVILITVLAIVFGQ